MANAASLPTQPFRLATGSQPARNFGLSFKRLRTPSMTGPFRPSIHRMVTIPILATLARPSWVQSQRILCNSLQPLLGDEREQLAHRAFEGKFERSPFIWFAFGSPFMRTARPSFVRAMAPARTAEHHRAKCTTSPSRPRKPMPPNGR
jgi:hypothetical protein